MIEQTEKLNEVIETYKNLETKKNKFSINFFIPLISNESSDNTNEFNILGGFLGLKTGEDAKIRILYIPIDL